MYVSLIVKDLVDVWRIVNPDSRRYTWRRKNPESHCRLDFSLQAKVQCAMLRAQRLQLDIQQTTLQ